jgi:hypothetical protein
MPIGRIARQRSVSGAEKSRRDQLAVGLQHEGIDHASDFVLVGLPLSRVIAKILGGCSVYVPAMV